MQSLQRAVQGAAPFESLPANLAARVAQLGRVVSYAAGKTIYDVSAPAEALYLVLQGEVEHTFDAGVAGASDPVRIVGAGGVFGWSALLRNQHGQDLRRRLAKAASRSRSEILVIPAEPLMQLLQSAPDAKQRVVRSMLDMVREVYGFAGFVKVHDHFVPARLSSSAADGPKDYDTFAF